MKVSEALAMAVSIPFAYPPHERKGRIVLDAGVASECPVWMAADQDPALPIVALRPRREMQAGERPSTIDAYFSRTLGSATRGLDDYIISQMPRVKLLEVDCRKIRSDQFSLSATQREQLIDAGRRAAEDGLSRLGPKLTKIDESRAEGPLGKPIDARALDHGTALMTRFHRDLSKQVSNRVFISYCHKDREWFERVKEVFGREFPLSSTWDDTHIEPSEWWQREIESALKASGVAVLLLSPNFFASEFISKVEVPAIVKASKNKRLDAYPIFVSAAEDGFQASPVNVLQAINHERPLDELTMDEMRDVLMPTIGNIKKKIQIA
jgi:hypothetical protein